MYPEYCSKKRELRKTGYLPSAVLTVLTKKQILSGRISVNAVFRDTKQIDMLKKAKFPETSNGFFFAKITALLHCFVFHAIFDIFSL